MLQTWATLPRAVRAVLARAHDQMCRALDEEMRAQEEPPLPLPAGVRVDGASPDSRTVYRFDMPARRRFSESARAECRFPHPTVRGCTISIVGTVAATERRHVDLAFREDLGPTIPAGGVLLPLECVAYMEARERLRAIEAGAVPFNTPVALRMIGEERLAASLPVGPVTPTDLPGDLVALRHLRLSQRDAIDGFLQLPFAALWGPPGTGKTFVLALASHYALYVARSDCPTVKRAARGRSCSGRRTSPSTRRCRASPRT